LIAIDYAQWAAIFPQGKALVDRATALEPLLGRCPSFEELANALLTGFVESEGVHFENGELTAEEYTLAQDLLVKRYTNPEWTFRSQRGPSRVCLGKSSALTGEMPLGSIKD
jgi:lipoate-protein ligase A